EERIYQAQIEAQRIAAEEQAAKEAEQNRLAQEEADRQVQVRQQQAEMERVAQEQEALAKKQAEEQRAWVVYQQQMAQREQGKTAPVVTNTVTNTVRAVAPSYKPQITEVKGGT